MANNETEKIRKEFDKFLISKNYCMSDSEVVEKALAAEKRIKKLQVV